MDRRLEELRYRRMLRRRKERNRRLFLLALALVFVITVVSVIIVFRKGGKHTNKKPAATVTPSVADVGNDITTPTPKEDTTFDIRICFCGDINFEDGGIPMTMLESVGGDLSKCISPELLEQMRAADIMVANNEFTYTTRGTPLEGKAWTFRANPSRVSLLKEMGVDVALLANNHAYDYGEVSLLDTMDTLRNAGIAYFGAGRNLEEAKKPLYLTVQGETIAFVAASRAEKNFKTPQATADRAGVLLCYEPALFVEAIKEARQNADYVIAVVHWGTEYSNALEQVQIDTGKLYLDAGADAVIGAHSHCPQPIDFYNGKPIVYSLSNFWFNEKALDSMLIELRIHGNHATKESKIDLYYTPAKQQDVRTQIAYGADREAIVNFMKKISDNRINIDNEGLVTPVEK